MTIRDIIGGREAYSIEPTATISEVVEYLCGKGVGAVAICEADRVVGVFSERDLMQRVVRQGLDPTQVKVSEVMTKNVFHVSIDERHDVAKALMLNKSFRHLVVLDEKNHLRGFVSMRELIEVDLTESKELIRKLNDNYYQHPFSP